MVEVSAGGKGAEAEHFAGKELVAGVTRGDNAGVDLMEFGH